MSKQISFPLLEITTLVVVLFACVLVIVPGFDEFATSMLFAPEGKELAVRSPLVAGVTPPESSVSALPSRPMNNLIANRGTFEVNDSVAPLDTFGTQSDSNESRNTDEPEFVEPNPDMEFAPESLEAPPIDNLASNDSSELMIDSSQAQLETAIEEDFALDESNSGVDNFGSSPQLDAFSSEQFDEIDVEPIEQNDTRYDLPTEDAPGRWSNKPDGRTAPDVAKLESPNFTTLVVDSMPQYSPPTQVLPLNEFVQPRDAFSSPLNSAELPKIINQVGSSRQLQASPTIIRIAEVFDTDSRVVVNPTFNWTADQRSGGNDMSAQQIAAPASPNAHPYQIRTTARPNEIGTGGNDFVPQR